MADIDNGALSFKSELDNSQLDSAVEETLRRVQGLTDATVSGGQKMDAAFDATAESIRSALSQIGAACETHESRIAELEAEYKRLGKNAAAAMMQGRDEEFRKIEQQQAAIKGEITTRQALLKELREYSNQLEDVAAKQEEHRKKVEENANTHQTLRSRIKELKEEMAQLVEQGIPQTSEAYKSLADELGRLQDIQSDVAEQGKVLANDQAQFQGIISGISGLSGAFSAATGAMSLFAGENEDLQKIMTKLQSVMAITIGLQQVSETLNKDSAFSLVTLRGIREWWNRVLTESGIVTTADTAATTANTASKAANATASTTAATAETANTAAIAAETVAAKAGTVANLTLAGAFRAVGVAIKSIPVIGWVIAGLSALIALVAHFVGKANEAKKAAKEFGDAVAENAYKPIGTIMQLSNEWDKLGDNMEAKEKFIEENRKKFDELGVAVKNTRDAENLLVANKDAFVNAQIAKAKALVMLAQTQEKVKKALELQAEIESMSDTKQVGYAAGNTGYVQYVTVENTAKTEKKKELQELNAEIKKGYESAYEYEKEGAKALQNAGINGVKEYAAGTVGAIEQAIAKKQEALKDLKPDTKEYNDAVAEINKMRKQIETKTTTSGGGSSSDKKDPFLEKLKARKAEYQRFLKWINSGDEVLVKAANTEFKGLLAEGSTYIDYLKNQRDKILAIGVDKRTKDQNANLRALNNAIAEETKKTVLEAFNEELSTQLNNAKSVLEVLSIIEHRRKALENDTTELGREKGEALDKAEKEALARQKQETDELLEQYAGYLDRKIKLEMQYNDDLKLLQKRRAEATTDAERASIDAAIRNRTAKYNRDKQSSGDADYDQLREQYQNYQQKVTQIRQDYEEKRRVATLHNDQEMLAQLAQAEANELSKLANEQLTGSIDWQRLFGNLDELSTKTINGLIGKINAKKIEFSGQFSPQDLQAINEQLEKARQEVESRNPFKAIGNAYERLREQLRNQKLLDDNDPFVQELNAKREEYDKYAQYIQSGDETLVKGADVAFSDLLKDGSTYLEYLRRKKEELQGKIDMGIDVGNSMEVLDAAISQAESGKSASDMMRESLKNTFSSVSSSLDFVKGAFDAVTGSLDKFGIEMDEESQAILNDIGGMIEGASQLSQGIATGNPLSVIQGSIGLLSSAFDLFNSRDRKAQRSIKKHKEEIERLENAYKQLEWQIGRALGGEVYANQQAAIRNMQKQQQELRGMIEDEKSKKKTDWGDIRKYEEQIAELDRNIQDMLDEIAKDILQTTAKDMANELGDALVEAFGKGEDAAQAFEKTVNEVLKNAVLNQLKKNFLEKQLQGALDQLEKSMGYWNGDNFIFDGLTDYEINQFKSRVQGIANTFNQAMGAYSDIFKDLDLGEKEDDTLTGAVKGVSEETASIIGGQMNAIRLNQVEVATILRQQLSVLSAIQRNTSYNFHLGKLTRILEILEANNGNDTNRANGLA
jgi:DNA repair exonuclease SbcCD ATPase subunit